MPGETEAGDVGAGSDTELREDFGRRVVRDQHLLDRFVEVRGRALAAHPCGHDGSGAERLRQDQDITGDEVPFAEEVIFIRIAGHREAQRQIVSFGGVSAGQHDSEFVERPRRSRQQFAKLSGLDRPASVRQCRNRQRGKRPSIHREQIADRMQRGDPTEEIRVIEERSEVIDRLHLDELVTRDAERFRSHAMHGRVLAPLRPQQHARVIRDVQLAQHGREDFAADFRSTTAAAHQMRCAIGRGANRWHLGDAKRFQPRAVDPFLPAAHEPPLRRQRSVIQDRFTVGRVHQAETISLRTKRRGRSPVQKREHIVEQDSPLSHGMHAVARQLRLRRECHAVSGAKHRRMTARLQRLADLNEPGFIEAQAARSQKLRRRGGSRPQDAIAFERLIRRKPQPTRFTADNARFESHVDAGLSQPAAHQPSHSSRKRREQPFVRLQQRQPKAGGVFRPMLNRQGQLTTARSATDDGEMKRSRRLPQRFVESLQLAHQPAERSNRQRPFAFGIVERRRGQ